MVSIKQIVFVAATTAGSAPLAAQAADMSFTPPIIAEEAIPQEIGSGWYLRGDVGYSRAQAPSVSFAGTGTTLSNAKPTDPLTFGIGAGYKFNEWLRADVTVDALTERRMAWTRSAGCYGLNCTPSGSNSLIDQVRQSFTPIMANAYIDFGSMSGFTPYIGGGIGAAYYRLDQGSYTAAVVTTTAPGATYVSQDTLTFGAHDGLSFAAAGMAGFSFDVGNGIAIDAGYRYLWIQKTRTGKGVENIVTTTNATDTTPGSTSTANLFTNGNAQFKDNTFHQFRVGVRYYLN